MKKLIVSFVFMSGVLSADIDFRAKGLFSIFRTKQYLSPVFGFAWWHGGQVEKLYRYGDPDHKTVQLIQELFYLNQGDGLTFGPTILPTKIGSYITPAAIGSILNVLDQFIDKQSLDPSDEQKLEKELEQVLAQELNFDAIVVASKHAQERLRDSLKPEIEKARKQAAELKSEGSAFDDERVAAEKAVKEYKQKVIQITGQHKALRKNKQLTPELQAQIDAKQQELDAAKARFAELEMQFKQAQSKSKQLKATMKDTVNRERFLESKIKNAAIDDKALHHFVALLVRAFEESLPDRKRYLPFTVHNIFLTMLYKKVTNKKEFITYFTQLNHSIFADSSLLVDNSPAQRIWLQEQYPKKSYQLIGAVVGSIQTGELAERLNHLKKNFELLTVAWYSYTVFTSVFPPQALSGWTSYNGHNFADCGSTSLRNALNNVIYMPSSGALLLSRLMDSFKVHERLRAFYDAYGSVEQIQEQQTRDAWAGVTSGLTGAQIDYKSGGVCEIAARGGIANMNHVVRALLGIESIDELAKMPHVVVSKQIAKDPNFGVYTFVIDGKYTFKWYFDPFHFFVSIDPAYIAIDPAIAGCMQTIADLLQKGDTLAIQQANNMIVSLLLVYRDRSSLFNEVISSVARIGLPNWYQDQLVMVLFDASSVHQKIQFIKNILAHAQLRSDKTNIEIIKRLVREMINDVEQHHGDIVTVLLQSPAIQDDGYHFRQELDKIVRDGINFLKANYPQLLSPIVDTIIMNKRDKYYGILKNNVPMTPQQSAALEQLQAEA